MEVSSSVLSIYYTSPNMGYTSGSFGLFRWGVEITTKKVGVLCLVREWDHAFYKGNMVKTRVKKRRLGSGRNGLKR